MNKVHIIGRLVATPELKQTASGLSVINFCVASDRKGTKGEDKVTDWIDCVAWRNTAEFISKYFEKGSPIIVSGNIQTRMYPDKDGKNRKAVEIIAEEVEFVPRAKGEATDWSAKESEGYVAVESEDLPF